MVSGDPYLYLSTNNHLWGGCHFNTSRPGSIKAKCLFCDPLLTNIFTFGTGVDVPRPVANAHLFVEEGSLLLFKRIKNYFETGRPSWSHLTCLKPAVAHFALAEGVFAGSLIPCTCHIWWWNPLKRAYLCEKSILFADVHLTGYFWMRGWVHGRWMGSRRIPLWKRKWNKRMSSQNLMEKYLNEWHGRGLGNEDKEKEHGACVEAAC